MISQEQALATAERWLNPEGQQSREVLVQEFDLVTGKCRPPATFGHSWARRQSRRTIPGALVASS
ncbi:hypothetical protein ACFV9W_07210 [Streptomyces sp. NPDC059897]|uniref:hypothetical protein n=1 Tax=Streptomyces sp. NPDC059897 TaxID=3346994 RepID=UPI0036624FC8